MKIELKSFKFYQRLSEETNAFSANIVVNGKKVGTADNSGKGEPTRTYISDVKIRDEVESYCDALPPKTWQYEGKTIEMKSSLETVVDDLVTELIKVEEEKKLDKKGQKLKIKYAEQGYPITLEIRTKTQVQWTAIRDVSKVEQYKQELATKFKVDVSQIKVL